jgi:dihydrofolate reductase
MAIALVVAAARNGVIGRDGDMPWRLSSDLKRFKSITMGQPIIMGRKTWESIGRPLPGRLNIVVTRHADFEAPGACVVQSLEEAIKTAREAAGQGDFFIVGGGQIYKETIHLADVLHVTHVETEIEGDAFFPPISAQDWQAVHEEALPAGEKDDYPTRYVIYRRRG